MGRHGRLYRTDEDNDKCGRHSLKEVEQNLTRDAFGREEGLPAESHGCSATDGIGFLKAGHLIRCNILPYGSANHDVQSTHARSTNARPLSVETLLRHETRN